MPNSRGSKQIGELIRAVGDNDIEQVKQLIQTLQITTKRRDQRNSPFACMSSRQNVSDNQDFESLVLEATRQNDATILTHFIELGANVNFSCRDETRSNATAPKMITPLHIGIENGNEAIIDTLISAGANVNVKDSDGQTPLHYCAERCDTVSARQLLFRGAHAAVTDNSGTTPLQIVSKYGHVEMVRILLEHDAQVFQRGQKGFSPLHIAASQGHVPLIDMLGRYVDVNIRTTSKSKQPSKTALHLACTNGLIETARFLVDRFAADIDLTDETGKTPLHCTLVQKHDFRKMRRKDDYDGIVEYLMKKDAQFDMADSFGNTPLFYAAKNQYHKAAEVLLMAGADPGHLNDNKQSPHDVIEEYDATMAQIFARNAPFSSPYISLGDKDKARGDIVPNTHKICLNDACLDTSGVQVYKTVVHTG